MVTTVSFERLSEGGSGHQGTGATASPERAPSLSNATPEAAASERRFLVTGGGGFIGEQITRALRQLGHSVTVLDLLPPQRHVEGVRYLIGDVRDAEAVREALRQVTGVFHLAAAHHDSNIERDTYFDVNERGTRTLTEVMTELGVHEICFFSSCAVYGGAPEPHEESGPTQPMAPYGASKLAAESILQQWNAESANRRILIMRPPVVFGPGNYANMFALIDQLARGRFARVGPGLNHKSLAYVENLVAATMFLWQQGHAGVFNYVDKPDMSSSEIAEVLSLALGRPAPRLYVPLPVALLLVAPVELGLRLAGRDPRISRARIRKFANDRTVFEADRVQATGFVPPVDLRDGLRAMARWYQREGAGCGSAPRLPSAQVVRGLRHIEAEA